MEDTTLNHTDPENLDNENKNLHPQQDQTQVLETFKQINKKELMDI